MRALFGTDGIRGRALEPPLDRDTVRRLGWALAAELDAERSRPHLLMGGDTRASTTTLAGWLAEAFQAAGGLVTWAGVLPTPGVSRLLRDGGFAAGVVISASHNPAPDNGIKILGPNGEKLADEAERRLEARLGAAAPLAGPGLPRPERALAGTYRDLVLATHRSPRPLDGLAVVVDCANGAASGLAGPLLELLGARVTAIADQPDGTNINHGCGATAPAALAAEVCRVGADAGLALDGDADRAILVDERGGILDGDDILLAWARHLHAEASLPGGTVVATVMSNFGLELGLQREGMRLIRCPVGDRSVWQAMAESGSALGGEQSGHVICAHHSVTGDGLLTGSHTLAIAAGRGCPLSQLSDLERLPQVLLNVPVGSNVPFEEAPAVQRAVEAARSQLRGRGRVLLRYSGTEPLARVMVEGEDDEQIQGLARHLAAVIERELG